MQCPRHFCLRSCKIVAIPNDSLFAALLPLGVHIGVTIKYKFLMVKHFFTWPWASWATAWGKYVHRSMLHLNMRISFFTVSRALEQADKRGYGAFFSRDSQNPPRCFPVQHAGSWTGWSPNVHSKPSVLWFCSSDIWKKDLKYVFFLQFLGKSRASPYQMA